MMNAYMVVLLIAEAISLGHSLRLQGEPTPRLFRTMTEGLECIREERHHCSEAARLAL